MNHATTKECRFCDADVSGKRRIKDMKGRDDHGAQRRDRGMKRAGRIGIGGVGLLIGGVSMLGATQPKEYAHPMITEVLFNVPGGQEADANKDGTRDATGDEFVEIGNPNATPMNLKGYRIVSRLSYGEESPRKGVVFTFPDFELPAHSVAVVFNGYGATIPGPVGTKDKAPEGPSEAFGMGFVFSMQMSARNNALSNSGDFVLLLDPAGRPVDGLYWGGPSPMPPSATDAEGRVIYRLQEVKRDPKGSVQRMRPEDELVEHSAIDGTPFSPGWIPGSQPKPAPEGQ